MLLPLLVLVTVSHMTAAQIVPKNQSIQTVSILQRSFSQVYISSSDDGLSGYVCFEGFWNVSEPNTCLRVISDRDDEKFNSLFIPQSTQLAILLQLTGSAERTFTLIFQNDKVEIEVNPEDGFKKVQLFVGNMVDSVNTRYVKSTESLPLKGCRTEEFTLSSGRSTCHPDGRLVYCSSSEQLLLSPCLLCTPLGCMIDEICSVTGDSVKTFDGRTLTIPDLCAYQLVGNNTYGTLDIKAFFRERLRKDFPLLDRVEITYETDIFEIGQRGVKMNNVAMNLTTPYVKMGTSISRTSSGFSFDIGSFAAVFDGDSFVIGIGKNSFEFKKGLCVSGDTTTPLNKDVYEQGCDVVHKEKNDTTIDCGELKQQAVMTQMCEDLLCRYPSVDTARCMFHEALAATCDLLMNPVTDWKNQTQCVSGTTVGKCMDPVCADHEFCELEKGEETCHCRAMFSSRHRADNTFGEPTVCSESSASLSLSLCLLKEKNIPYDKLQLNNPNCTGQLGQEPGMVTFGFNSTNMCGTEVSVKDNTVLHSNKVLLSNSGTGLITRHDQFELDFSCFYSAPQVQSVGLKIKDSSVMTTITAGDWSYNLSIVAYGDEGRTKALAAGANITLDQSLWVELKAEGLDQDLVALVTDNCWATNEAASNATLKYDLVKAGCPNAADQSVSVHQNGLGTSNYFSFNTFEFRGSSSSDLYLHCEVSLCLDKEKCAPSCTGKRRRRSLRRDRALISMFWAE